MRSSLCRTCQYRGYNDRTGNAPLITTDPTDTPVSSLSERKYSTSAPLTNGQSNLKVAKKVTLHQAGNKRKNRPLQRSGREGTGGSPHQRPKLPPPLHFPHDWANHLRSDGLPELDLTPSLNEPATASSPASLSFLRGLTRSQSARGATPLP